MSDVTIYCDDNYENIVIGPDKSLFYLGVIYDTSGIEEPYDSVIISSSMKITVWLSANISRILTVTIEKIY